MLADLLPRQSIRLLLAAVCLAWCVQAASEDQGQAGGAAFAQEPVVTRNGDKVSVTFETAGFCDVAVAVEGANGKVLCHVAGGLLGPNAPEPLQKDTKKQTVVWEGKTDAGVYVDDKEACSLRVSLGLAPRFERTLYWSPHKRWGRNAPVVTAAPEGVYVYEGDNVDSVRLYDHDGAYVRTVYPFPAGKLAEIKGLRWREAAPGGTRIPFKEGFYQATFLNSGFNGGFDETSGFGVTHYPSLAYSWAEDAPDFAAAGAMAVARARVALVGPLGLNRLATDGGTGGADLTGSRFKIEPNSRQAVHATNAPVPSPRSAAFSPDGKWVYVTGYSWPDDSKHSSAFGGGRRWLNGVLRVKFDGNEAPAAFAGSMNPEDPAGNAPDKLNSPTSVACDAQGNVYVADCGNNRIQVFSPEGKLLESIPAERPTALAVHQKNAEIYVCTWPIRVWAPESKAPPALTRIGPPGKREKIATYPLPLEIGSTMGDVWASGLQFRVELDSWAEPPVVWVVTGAPILSHAGNESENIKWGRGALKLLAVEKDKLVPKKDFAEEALKRVSRQNLLTNARQLMAVSPKTEKLYVLEGRSMFNQLLEIDPETGKERLVDLPHASDDFCFDMDGYLYLTTGALVTRFDPNTLREVPWDYGEERERVGAGGHGEKSVNSLAALVLPGRRPSSDDKCHTCGIAISPNGFLAAYCYNVDPAGLKAPNRVEKAVAETGRTYAPQIYPGRQRWGELHVWNRQGNVRYADAVPGLGFTDGLAIDKYDNLFVLAGAASAAEGKGGVNPRGCTLMKFKPGKARILNGGEKYVPLALQEKDRPKAPPQLAGPLWVEGADWMCGGVGYSGWEWSSRFALDLYARSFVPVPDRFAVAVLDTNGNRILEFGRCGNVDDGKPLVADPQIPEPHAIGGDEVALMHACYVALQSDRRVFVSDAGNRRIASVRLGYRAEEKIALKDVPDQAGK